MPKFRFTAADSFGTTHDGTIDASTADAARNKLASNGLAVRTVEEVTTPEGDTAPEPSRRITPKPETTGSGAVPVLPRRSETSEPAARRGGSPFPIVFSLLALFVSLGTAVYTMTRDPLKSRLDKYNFSSPEEAYLSSVRMAADGDYLARFERENKLISSAAREQFLSSQIERVENYNGKVVLFITFKRNGKERKIVRWFEKDPDTKMWKRSWQMDSEALGGGPGLPHDLADRIARHVTPFDATDGIPGDVDW